MLLTGKIYTGNSERPTQQQKITFNLNENMHLTEEKKKKKISHFSHSFVNIENKRHIDSAVFMHIQGGIHLCMLIPKTPTLFCLWNAVDRLLMFSKYHFSVLY